MQYLDKYVLNIIVEHAITDLPSLQLTAHFLYNIIHYKDCANTIKSCIAKYKPFYNHLLSLSPQFRQISSIYTLWNTYMNIDRYRDQKLVYTHVINDDSFVHTCANSKTVEVYDAINVLNILKTIEDSNRVWIILHGDIILHNNILTKRTTKYIYNAITNDLLYLYEDNTENAISNHIVSNSVSNNLLKYLPFNYYAIHKQHEIKSGFSNVFIKLDFTPYLDSFVQNIKLYQYDNINENTSKIKIVGNTNNVLYITYTDLPFDYYVKKLYLIFDLNDSQLFEQPTKDSIYNIIKQSVYYTYYKQIIGINVIYNDLYINLVIENVYINDYIIYT